MKFSLRPRRNKTVLATKQIDSKVGGGRPTTRSSSSRHSASRSLDSGVSADDTESTASSSKRTIEEQTCELSLADESNNDSRRNEDYRFEYKFRKGLIQIFEGKANKTVLLTEPQMEEIRQWINEDYTQVLLDETLVAPRSDFEAHMRCTTHVLSQFWDVQEIIQQTKMATTTREVIFLELEEFIFPRTMYQIDSLRPLSPELASVIISWMHDIESQLQQYAPEIDFREEWTEERTKLLAFYLDHAVKQETRTILSKAIHMHSQDDIHENAEGHLLTGLPEQISYVINQQLRVASECLPQQYLENVLAVCNEELALMVNNWTIKILEEWETMESPYFCAIINDLPRLSDYCDQRKEDYLTRPDLIEAAENLTCDMTELSLHVTRYLCEHIIKTLSEPEQILTAVGNSAWEDPDDHSPIERAVATFEDFFMDIEKWLIPGYFFPKVLKKCFDLALTTYIQSFFTNTMIDGVHESAAVAQELETDYLRFVVFFNGENFIDYHGRGGFYTQKEINDRLRILQHMAALVDPTNLPRNLFFEIQEVIASFGENGEPAVLHLVGLRKQKQRSANSLHWIKQIASAKKELASLKQGEAPPLLCTLPDVGNSQMLQKIAPPPRALIPRELSDSSRPFAQSTVLLLKPSRRRFPQVATNNIAVLNPIWHFAQRKLHDRMSVEQATTVNKNTIKNRETANQVINIDDSEDDDDDERVCKTCTLAEF